MSNQLNTVSRVDLKPTVLIQCVLQHEKKVKQILAKKIRPYELKS